MGGGNAWRAVTTSSAPTARIGHSAVWTGSEVIVWGGRDASGAALPTGGRYDPVQDRWVTMSVIDAAEPRSGQRACWAGNQMLVTGGDGSNPMMPPVRGGRYRPE